MFRIIRPFPISRGYSGEKCLSKYLLCSNCPRRNVRILSFLSNNYRGESQLSLNRTQLSACSHWRIEISRGKRWSVFSSNGPSDGWNNAIMEAEKVVGYPTSFMSLRCLLNDELANVAMQMRKLVAVGAKHPLLTTARKFVYDGDKTMQIRGLMILLISKAAGPGPHLNNNDSLEWTVNSIHPRQRLLGEITEMMYTAYLVHRGIVSSSTSSDANIVSGNKMAVLSGDFLLANASQGLADLRNTDVVYLMAKALRDLFLSAFQGYNDINGNSCLPEYPQTLDDWQQQNVMMSAGLVSRSCQSSMLLAGHSTSMQQDACQFGLYAGLAHQIHEEIQNFQRLIDSCQLDLTSAPVIAYLQQTSHTIADFYDSNLKIQSLKMHQAILASDSLQICKCLAQRLGEKACAAIEKLPDSEAKQAIKQVLKAVTYR